MGIVILVGGGLVMFWWMLIPVAAQIFTPRRFMGWSALFGAIFYASLFVYAWLNGKQICEADGMGCPTSFLMIPAYLVSVVLFLLIAITRSLLALIFRD
jgi:hypothetical protein